MEQTQEQIISELKQNLQNWKGLYANAAKLLKEAREERHHELIEANVCINELKQRAARSEAKAFKLEHQLNRIAGITREK